MRTFLYIIFLLVFSFSFISCISCTDLGEDSCCSLVVYHYLPQAILLNINAVNEMENPVNIKIRHKYFQYLSTGNNDYTSDWSSSYNLASGETKPIGIEQAKRWDADSEWYDEGFVLLSENDEYHRIKNRSWFYSSFEIDVSTDTTTLFNIPGYAYNSDFLIGTEREKKCYGLSISQDGSCKLEFNEHGEWLNLEYLYCPCRESGCSCGMSYCYSYNPSKSPQENQSGFSLPVNLTIKSDGIYTLEFGDIQQNKK